MRLLKSRTTTATTLAAIVLDKFGAEGLEFEPEVLRTELEKEAGAAIPEINMDKFGALTAAIATDFFYFDPQSFNLICNSLGGFNYRVNPELWETPEPEEVAWTVFEIFLNDPPTGDSSEFGNRFSPIIKEYIALILTENGVSTPPTALRFIEIPEQDVVDVFADDPTLYAAYHRLQSENVQQIESYIKDRFRQLITELQHAELANAEMPDFFEKFQI